MFTINTLWYSLLWVAMMIIGGLMYEQPHFVRKRQTKYKTLDHNYCNVWYYTLWHSSAITLDVAASIILSHIGALLCAPIIFYLI